MREATRKKIARGVASVIAFIMILMPSTSLV